MGVPVFFKWLSTRNPKILLDAKQPQQSAPYSVNPYIDNFYIDMNGLIHPACNPKGQNIKEPKNFQQQIANVYEYIDKLINIVRPQKMIYMAIDGVAPRAKMNQQRSRRFRAAMQSANMQQEKKKLYQKFQSQGIKDPQIENYINKKSFDSNVITPGTQFLSQVCKRLNNYIHDRIANHSLWKNLTVVFSDANCPGQGQHKIMEFIRQQRASEGYRNNQSHCIYGADADLIMLTLATHQPKFFVIREVVITANDKWCTKCGKKGHYFLDCGSNFAQSIDDQMRVNQQTNAEAINVEFQFIKIQMVRQYIHLHYHKATMNFTYDLERVLDDFVFLCFFVGNDFLPHVPCLSIRDGGIDVLMKIYQYCLVQMSDYLTFCGQVNSQSLAIFLNEISKYEDSLIEEMMIKQAQNKNRQNFNKQRNESNQRSQRNSKSSKQQAVIFKETPIQLFKDQLKKIQNQQNNIEEYSSFEHDIFMYKEKYYREKFRIVPLDFMEFKHNINKSYMQALRWICHYYYKGVASWSWFYPFHYSPFFSDMKVTKNQLFQLGKPFKPFQQLLAVFPQKTASAVPRGIQKLMLDIDSPIADYFPKSFVIDIVGKKFAWLGEVLLPFIDDMRVLSAMGDYETELTQEQKFRNRMGRDLVFTNRYGKLGQKVSKFLKIGTSMIVTHSENGLLEGEIQLKKQQQQTLEYYFLQPSGRIHSIELKNKSEFQYLEQLDDEYFVQTDKKGFGGQRFVRVIERVLAKTRNTPHPIQKNNQIPDNRNLPTQAYMKRKEEQMVDYRQRSRNKRDYVNQQYRSDSPENRRRDNQERYNARRK